MIMWLERERRAQIMIGLLCRKFVSQLSTPGAVLEGQYRERMFVVVLKLSFLYFFSATGVDVG